MAARANTATLQPNHRWGSRVRSRLPPFSMKMRDWGGEPSFPICEAGAWHRVNTNFCRCPVTDWKQDSNDFQDGQEKKILCLLSSWKSCSGCPTHNHLIFG